MEDETFMINDQEIEWSEMVHGELIAHKRKDFTQKLTGNKMVASLYEVPPGKASWPFHFHTANEEAFYILEGEGELRCYDKRIKVSAGDFLSFPVGEKGVHQLKNISSEKPLKYLDFGTTNQPDIVFMPDSNKVGIFAGSAPCQNNTKRTTRKYFALNSEIDYLAGE